MTLLNTICHSERNGAKRNVVKNPLKAALRGQKSDLYIALRKQKSNLYNQCSVACRDETESRLYIPLYKQCRFNGVLLPSAQDPPCSTSFRMTAIYLLCCPIANRTYD